MRVQLGLCAPVCTHEPPAHVCRAWTNTCAPAGRSGQLAKPQRGTRAHGRCLRVPLSFLSSLKGRSAPGKCWMTSARPGGHVPGGGHSGFPWPHARTLCSGVGGLVTNVGEEPPGTVRPLRLPDSRTAMSRLTVSRPEGPALPPTRPAQAHPVAGLYPLVDKVREGLAWDEAAGPGGDAQGPVLQHNPALTDDHARGSSALQALEDVVLHVLGGQRPSEPAGGPGAAQSLRSQGPGGRVHLAGLGFRGGGRACTPGPSGTSPGDTEQASSPPRQGPLPPLALPVPGHPGWLQGAPRPRDGLHMGPASLTRLWLLAEMILVARGFHMTRSASEPTATRPFLG